MPNLKLEKTHVNQFIKLIWSYPIIAVPQTAPEPDFMVESKDGRIGIEHTQLIRVRDSQNVDIMAHSKIADKIMAEAEALFKSQHELCLMVHVDFRCDYGLAVSEPIQLFNDDIKPLSRFLVDFIVLRLPILSELAVMNSLHFETYDWNTLTRVLPDKITSIRIYNTSTFQQACWTPSQGGAIPGIFGSVEFREQLTKKNKKPKNYKGDYDEIWLLMVEDSMDLTSYFDFDDQVPELIQTTFNRVFVLRRAENTVLELPKITQPT
jgi:hypothetical protein